MTPKKKAPPAAEPEATPEPEVTTTRTIKVRLTPPHSETVLDWCTFAAAVAALARQVPAGVNPTVHVRYGTISLTWPE